MEIGFGVIEDIDMWMKLVSKVRWKFPGLETAEAIEKHRNTVIEFMKRNTAICAKENNSIIGVLLFSIKYNMICCMAVDPDYRRKHVASEMFSLMFRIADKTREITVSTFREEDIKGIAPRAFYKKYGFVADELTEEFGYQTQKFILHR